MKGKDYKRMCEEMRTASVVAVVMLSCGIALCDSISNLSQIVGIDLTHELCQGLPSGSGFANWEAVTLATLRAIRMGDATNFVANTTAGMLNREFEIALTNDVPATFAQAFSLTSAEFSRYYVTSYAVITNAPERVCVDINVLLRRGISSHDILETLNFSLLKTNYVWKVDGL